MATDADIFASTLFEESKRFLEKATDASTDLAAEQAYLHAALMLAFGSLEAYVNNIGAEFDARKEFSILERSIMSERDFDIEHGVFRLSKRLKMWRLQDRILFLGSRLCREPLPRNEPWWSDLLAGLELRNQLTHPKGRVELRRDAVESAINATLSVLDFLYQGIYKARFPPHQRGLRSKLTF